MSIFTPVDGLIGGSLIGLSAAVLLLFNGDILGASGITSTTLLEPRKALTDPAMLWKLAFISSFLLTTVLFLADPAIADPAMQRPPLVSRLGYGIGGILVGFGTKLGNGCTSGHGICGLARLSKRSFVAVGSFMATAFITTFLLEGPLSSHTEFLRTGHSPDFETLLGPIITGISIGLSCLAAFIQYRETPSLSNYQRKALPAVASGALFATGLFVSGMVFPAKIFGFLNLAGISDGTFDPTLITVMGGGAVVSFLSYQLVKGHNFFNHSRTRECPLAMTEACEETGKFNVPTNTTVDSQLVLGSAVFGIGWAIGGLCPGPALFHVASGYLDVVILWWPTFLLGSFLAQALKNHTKSPVSTLPADETKITEVPEGGDTSQKEHATTCDVLMEESTQLSSLAKLQHYKSTSGSDPDIRV